ncbi:MAG TPA: hypothetical protein PKC98_05085, partial [Candidatus Melainabacteria bacterium]|nr:hypothetical protein [Candidatus Melainabacteria bacterium]
MGETGINNSAIFRTFLFRLLSALAFVFIFINSPEQSLAAAPSKNNGDADLSPIKLVKKGYRAFLRAQNEPPVICTDRNSVTPHPNVVPLGYLQFENGSTFDLYRRGGDIILPETEVRLGT